MVDYMNVESITNIIDNVWTVLVAIGGFIVWLTKINIKVNNLELQVEHNKRELTSDIKDLRNDIKEQFEGMRKDLKEMSSTDIAQTTSLTELATNVAHLTKIVDQWQKDINNFYNINKAIERPNQ